MKQQIVKLGSFLIGAGLALVSVIPVIAQSSTTVASLFLNPSTKSASYVAGATNEFTIDLVVNTGGQPVVGVDAVVTFTATDLQFVSANNAGSQFTIPIVIAQGSGKQLVTGLITPGSTTPVVSSSTTPAKVSTLTFKTLHTGSTTIGISQLESNVAHQTPSMGDILGATTGATVTITATQPPVGQVLNSVTIPPASATIATGASQTFVAVASDASGYPISTGITYTWDFGDGPNIITAPATTSHTFTNPGTYPVVVTSTQGSISKTATSHLTVQMGNFIPGTGGTSPYISSVQPSYGNKDVVRQVTISGGNFGEYDTSKSKVFVGLLEATVLDWNNNQILAQFPANSSLTAQATLTVRVLTASDTQASFVGYTYTMGSLPNNGPEDILWVGVVLVALGASWLAYRKMQVSEVTAEPTNIDPVRDLAQK